MRSYRADPSNPPAEPLTDPKLIRDYIHARAACELAKWDVFIASSTRRGFEPVPLAQIDLVPFDRSVDSGDDRNGILTISGTSRRIGSSEDEREGLLKDQIDAALEACRLARPDKKLAKTVSPRIYRQVPGRRPLLILRLVRPKTAEGEGDAQHSDDVLAWGLSFPSSDIAGGTVEYVVNTIRMRGMFGEERSKRRRWVIPNDTPWTGLEADKVDTRRVDAKGHWNFFWAVMPRADVALVVQLAELPKPVPDLPKLRNLEIRFQTLPGGPILEVVRFV